MLRIGIAGINGRMGREVAALAVAAADVDLVGGVGRASAAGTGAAESAHAAGGSPLVAAATDGSPNLAAVGGVPVAADVAALLPRVDVLIDFTAPAATVGHARACAGAGVPLVSGTTGLDPSQLRELRAAARRIALFYAPNMSPGVNAVLAALPPLVRALADYDVEIVEAHHRHKADAPSGTALALARSVVAARGGGLGLDARTRFGRHGSGRRPAEEIGIHAVRGGSNPGEHTVILAGDGEEVRLAVRAFGRTAYARGALRAARLIAGLPPGWYEPATLPGFCEGSPTTG